MSSMKHKQNSDKPTVKKTESVKFVAKIKKEEKRPVILSSIQYSRMTSPQSSTQKFYQYGIR